MGSETQETPCGLPPIWLMLAAMRETDPASAPPHVHAASSLSAGRFAAVGPRLPSPSVLWEGDGFRSELATWITGSIAAEPTSLVPVKVRPWATVWRAETRTGTFFAKQNCPAQDYEARLLDTLNDLAPSHVVPLAAADHGLGLLLTPDQGTVLGETTATVDVETWCRVTSGAARLQLAVAPHTSSLVEAGLTTLAPSDAQAYVEDRVAALAALPAGDPRALPDGAADRLHALLPTVAEWADQVAELGLPLTLCHNDLHDHNVFDRGGELRFFDFADALVMEPLAALLVPLNVLRHRLEASPDDPRLRRVADAALEVWTDHATAAELRAALPAALQLARLARVESWIRCTASMSDEELAEWGDTAAYWLGSLGDEPPVRF